MKLVFSFFIFVFLTISIPAHAHETKFDGSLGVLLHMEPQDSPVIKETAKLFFYFEDAKKEFSLSDCNCVVTIELEGKTIFSQKLTNQEKTYGSNVSSIEFSFPKKAIYKILLTGASLKNAFKQFHIEYNARVERESINETPINPQSIPEKNPFFNAYWIFLGIIASFAILLILFRKKIKKLKL